MRITPVPAEARGRVSASILWQKLLLGIFFSFLWLSLGVFLLASICRMIFLSCQFHDIIIFLPNPVIK